MQQTARRVEKELKKLGAKERAKAAAWYFKTGPGQYGAGDIFLGVSVPNQRKIAKKFQNLSLLEITKLLKNKHHECRLTGLFILVLLYRRPASRRARSRTSRNSIAKLYLKNARQINNWDLVDSSAPNILGDYLLDKNKDILYKLSRSKNLWERRIAVLSTFAFIKHGQFEDSFKIAEILLKDSHDLIHKAAGWMLREIGKRNLPALENFLKKFGAKMPRTMLRYAIEKFPPKKRLFYLKSGPLDTLAR